MERRFAEAKWRGKESIMARYSPVTMVVACSLFIFNGITMVLALIKDDGEGALLALASMLLLNLPVLLEYPLRVRLPTALLVSALFFTTGPVLGNVYKLYYKFPLWDKLVHTLCGFIFAALGYVLPGLTDGKNPRHSALLCCLCALCLALSVAVFWEFFEFGMDTFFAMDMQKDSVVTGIVSDLLGGNTGTPEVIEEINSVVVNDRELGLNGYLDIGLYDTMYDMLVSALGAGVFCILTIFKGGRWAAPFLPQVLRTE